METIARNQAGQDVPVIVTASFSESRTANFNLTLTYSGRGTSCTLFIRDLRAIQGFQKLIEQNEELLCKMLPKSIANRLKSSVATAKDSNSVLIAGIAIQFAAI